MQERTMLRNIWKSLSEFFSPEPLEKIDETERSMSMGRVYDKLYSQLAESEEWAYPVDLFVGDDGQSLFAIVAQGGRLFQVPLTISEESVTQGTWVQVTESYSPVEQAKISIRRSAGGPTRWLMIAGTTVLNRVGEIDSTSLFQSFIELAERTGEYPRLDFYHLGRSDPDLWEFGTADFLALDDCCYIASGTFDEGHPLAEAFQRSQGSGVWGASIEFESLMEPELILSDPEVWVPVYTRGKNTRISVVLEEDAAGIYTRSEVLEEKVRMREDIAEKLKLLFGEDEESLNKFIEQVDGVNRSVVEQGLIRRQNAPVEESNLEPESTTESEKVDEAAEVLLTEEDLSFIGREVISSPEFGEIVKVAQRSSEDVSELKSMISQQADQIKSLEESVRYLTSSIMKLQEEETEKRREWLQDLPARKQVKATYRPREVHQDLSSEETEITMAEIAAETLRGIPSY